MSAPKAKFRHGLTIKHWHAFVNRTLPKIWLMGGSMYPEIQYHGITEAASLLPITAGRDRQEKINIVHNDIVGILRNRKLQWSYWYLAFYLDENGEEQFEARTLDLGGLSALEADEVTTPMMQKLVDTIPEDRLTGYGWVATPSQESDLDAVKERFLERFRQARCYDRKHNDDNVAAGRLEQFMGT